MSSKYWFVVRDAVGVLALLGAYACSSEPSASDAAPRGPDAALPDGGADASILDATLANDGGADAPCAAPLQLEGGDWCAGWKPAGGPEPVPESPTLTRLTDGRVLAVGGTVCQGFGCAPTPLAWIFDPATLSWRATASMTTPRRNHAAAILGDGRVLVIGGQSGLRSDDTVYDTTEVFDPRSERWSAGPPLPMPRSAASAVALTDGSVLVVAGFSSFAATTLEHTTLRTGPGMSSWQEAGEVPLDGGATTLAALSGVGAFAANVTGTSTQLWVFNGAEGNRWSDAGSLPAEVAATAASEGTALLVSRTSAAVWSPGVTTPELLAGPPTSALNPVLVPLRDGLVLYVGDREAAVFDIEARAWRETAPTMLPRSAGTVGIGLGDGRAMIVSGNNRAGGDFSPAEVYEVRPQSD